MAFLGPSTSLPIGNDILDIGSRKALTKRQRGIQAEFGRPGQFDVPNVPDVSCVVVNMLLLCTFMDGCLLIGRCLHHALVVECLLVLVFLGNPLPHPTPLLTIFTTFSARLVLPEQLCVGLW